MHHPTVDPTIDNKQYPITRMSQVLESIPSIVIGDWTGRTAEDDANIINYLKHPEIIEIKKDRSEGTYTSVKVALGIRPWAGFRLENNDQEEGWQIVTRNIVTGEDSSMSISDLRDSRITNLGRLNADNNIFKNEIERYQKSISSTQDF